MLALPVVLLFWICGYFWKQEGWLRTAQMDVDAGRRPIDWEAHHREQEKRRNAKFAMRMVYKLF
jgi:amino acid transporter